MAKDSFLLYTEWGEQINKLSDEQAGLLIKSIFAYKDGKEVPSLDPMTEMCFSVLKSTIDRDAEKYDEICEKRREAGKKGGQANGSKCKQMQANANFAKHYDNDNEYEYEYDNKTSSHGLIDTRARVREEEDDFDDEWDPDKMITTTDGKQIRLGDVRFGKTIKQRQAEAGRG